MGICPGSEPLILLAVAGWNGYEIRMKQGCGEKAIELIGDRILHASLMI